MFEPQPIPVVSEPTTTQALPRNPQTLIEKLTWIEGRIGRGAYIGLSLLQLLIAAMGFAVGASLLNVSEPLAAGLLISLGLALFWSMLAVTAKRFHDFDASGWWQLLGVVPLIGWLLPFYLALKSGTDGPNRFGARP